MRSLALPALLVLFSCAAGSLHASHPDVRPGGSAQAGDYGPQASIEAAFSTYLRILEQQVKDPQLGLYSPETRRLLGARPMTGQQQRRERAEIQAVYARRVVTERGDLGVIRFADAPRVPPYFFRRGPAGWTIDLAAASRTIGFDRSDRWYVRDPNSEFAFGF